LRSGSDSLININIKIKIQIKIKIEIKIQIEINIDIEIEIKNKMQSNIKIKTHSAPTASRASALSQPPRRLPLSECPADTPHRTGGA